MHNLREVHTRLFPWFALALAVASQARAQTSPTGASVVLPAVTVTAPADLEKQPTDAASEQRISGETLNARPVTRPAEILEAVPGLIVTQHSGEGKANQYFLRGFNLDHGTDIGIWLDGMPINLRTHAHGQGYSDLNFMIPELVDNLLVRKGPYWAQEGDFSSAGAIHISYADRLEKNLLSATAGSFGFWRGLAAGSMTLGQGTLTGAGEIVRYDGPWDIPDAVRKYNGVLRYSEGTAENGFALTGMAYTNSWHSTDQIALRAVDGGLIGRFGTLDPTDGGDSQRYSLSARWSQSDERTTDRVQGYLVYSTLNLYNNFTYFLNNPVNGDQFQQADKRFLMGLDASRSLRHSFMGFEAESVFGLQVRNDIIDVGLFNTVQRVPTSTIRTDHVNETSAGLYVEEKVKWNGWLRSTVGLRGDLYWTTDSSSLAGNSAQATAFLPQPKLGMVFGPFDKTEFYVNAGMGFHSNDVRGLAQNVPLLVQSQGAEVGMRTQAIKGLDSTLAVFVLDFDSELTFSGDSGDTEPNRPSRRIGVEWANRYRAAPWAILDGDFAYTYVRFKDTDNPIAPNQPRSSPSVMPAEATMLNLLNAQADQITYYYTSRLQGEPLEGVNDVHFHPVEPLAVRFTLSKAF
jgi:hypothetical protein